MKAMRSRFVAGFGRVTKVSFAGWVKSTGIWYDVHAVVARAGAFTFKLH